MAKVPLPERGQPLDVTYIYQIADALNDLSSQVSSATYNYTTVDTKVAGTQSIKTSDARVVGKYKEIANKKTTVAGDEINNFCNFDGDFKYPPVVTASVVNIDGTPAGNASIVLNSITTSRVDFTVKFGISGTASVGVNIIAVGIPN